MLSQFQLWLLMIALSCLLIVRCFSKCLLACLSASTYLFAQMLKHVQMCRHCAWTEFPSHFADGPQKQWARAQSDPPATTE